MNNLQELINFGFKMINGEYVVGFFFFIFDLIFNGVIKERKYMVDKFDYKLKLLMNNVC